MFCINNNHDRRKSGAKQQRVAQRRGKYNNFTGTNVIAEAFFWPKTFVGKFNGPKHQKLSVDFYFYSLTDRPIVLPRIRIYV